MILPVCFARKRSGRRRNKTSPGCRCAFKRAAAAALLLACVRTFAVAADAQRGAFLSEPTGSYTMQKGDGTALSESLAIFQAKRAAVEAAQLYFARRERIAPLGRRKDEIVNFTADRVAFDILEQKWTGGNTATTCEVRLIVRVRPSDLIEGEIESLRLEKVAEEESYRQEMEPSISLQSPPGHDIAAAFRHIRRGELRPAIIYLDRLQRKYPNWSDIFELKALAYDLHNEPIKMQQALRKACQLGSRSGCDHLRMLALQAEGKGDGAAK